MDSDEYLLLSDVTKYSYCINTFTLTKIEGYWADNIHTVIGSHLHKKTDDITVRETRGNKFIARGLEVVSHELKIRGRLDTFNLSMWGCFICCGVRSICRFLPSRSFRKAEFSM